MTAARRQVWMLELAAALLLAVLAAKSAAVFLAAAPAHQVAMQRREMRYEQKSLAPAQLVNELDGLLQAVRWTPGDADVWYHLGRNFQRLAAEDVEIPAYLRDAIQARLDLTEETLRADRRTMRLTAAATAYERAMAANQLVSGARFWRLVARLELSNPAAARWAAELRSQIEAALRYDPHDPAAWRAAGDLAWRFADWDTARRWYKASLAWKPDGLEHVAERLLSLPDGPTRLADVLPPQPEAWRRLARYQFTQWRFASARDSFARAMQLANRRAVYPPEGEAVFDGSFTTAPELLLSPWMIESARGVELKRRRADHDPPRLEATFRFGPGNWYHVAQQVMVAPGRRYRLSARVRVDGFEPEETFGVEVVHPYDVRLFAANAKCYADLPMAARLRERWPVCAKEFTAVEQTFTAPDDVLMLTLRLRRFDGDEAHGGQVAFAEVSLQALPDLPPPEVADAR